MFIRSKTSQHDLSRLNLRRLSGAALLSALSLFLLAGCGGGGGNGNTGGGGTTGSGTAGTGTSGTGTSGTGTGPTSSSLPAGSYQGVYLNTSGTYSPDAGTITFTVASSGAVSGSSYDFTGDGSTNSFTGTVSSTGVLVTHSVGSTTDGLTGTLSQNSTTHVFSASYTEPNGTKGALSVGPVPTTTSLAGSYSGSYTSKGGGQGTATLTIGTNGAVTGTTLQQGTSGTVSGYVDSGGNIFLADASGGVAQIATGPLTPTGASLTGTLALSGSDGSSDTITVTLTKH